MQYLRHDFFKKYSNLQLISSIRPGIRKGDPVVTNLKWIQYKPELSLNIKLNFSDEFSTLPRRIKIPSDEIVLEPLYHSKIPLQASKFKHLQELKSVLPKDVHSYYDKMPHYLPNSVNKICKGDNCSCIRDVSVC